MTRHAPPVAPADRPGTTRPAATIRRAVPADGPMYIELVRALADFERLPAPDPDACQRLLVDAFSDPPAYELWVAELPSGDLAAYAVVLTTYSTFLAKPTLFLEDLFVHPRARRRGIATQMMTNLRTLASERGCGRMEWTVLDWNRGAQDLYERLGAETLADWRIMRMVL